MTQNDILAEVKKAIDLWMDKTYNESEFYSHIMTIVNENSVPGNVHKDQLERLMFKVEELRENQHMYYNGHKNKLGTCKSMEAELDKKITYLKTVKGYKTDRFRVNATQNNMFR